MPGMSASPDIFEYIRLPKEQYTTHLLSWIKPKAREPIEQYAQRMCQYIQQKEVVLIGVSLGGVVVQEMAKLISTKRLILISTVKSKFELPRSMRMGQKTKLYRILPTSLVKHFKKINTLPIGRHLKKRLKLYERYVGPIDKYYLDWAIEQLLNWSQQDPPMQCIHIHGTRDHIFPIKNIKHCIRVNNGTHLMIINRYAWFNQHLPSLIEKGALQAS